MNFQATTVGLGPYAPAVKWRTETPEGPYERIWVHPSRKFDREDDAAVFAEKILTQIGDAANEALTSEDFAPTTQKKDTWLCVTAKLYLFGDMATPVHTTSRDYTCDAAIGEAAGECVEVAQRQIGDGKDAIVVLTFSGDGD